MNQLYDRRLQQLENQLEKFIKDNNELQVQNDEMKEHIQDIEKEIAVNFDEIKIVLDGLKEKLKSK